MNNAFALSSLFLFQAYVIWYSVSNFFIPLLMLMHCYGKMCSALWRNYQSKKEAQKHDRRSSQQYDPDNLMSRDLRKLNRTETISPGQHTKKKVSSFTTIVVDQNE